MNSDSNSSVIVIGGGAAGMIAGWRAGTLGAKVILIEKNAKLGIKLLISGGGKCNITHSGEMELLRKQFIPKEARFLKPSFYQFSNSDILRSLHQFGVETYEREDGRVFPTSGKAGDVVHALRRMMERAAVEIRLSSPVERIVRDENGVSGVQTSTSFIPSRHVILATGGSSYPKTGTTGDGFRWGEDLGHTVIPIRSALAPMYLEPSPPAEWQGVPIRNCILEARSAGKTVAEWKGDVLITHQGISGPATLEISRDTYLAWEKNRDVTIYIDTVPEESETQFEMRFQQEIVSNGTRNVETLVELFLPTRLAPFILLAAHVDGSKKCHQLQKEERQAIVRVLKNWNIGKVKEIPLERGEVTAGGIDLHEVDPASMSSRLVKGLYLCGEVLDIVGPIGGYNLQAAFSTGYVAGETAAKNYKTEKLS